MTTSNNPPHPLVAYRQLWEEVPNAFLHYQFERKDPAAADSWANAHPVAPHVVGGGTRPAPTAKQRERHDEVR